MCATVKVYGVRQRFLSKRWHLGLVAEQLCREEWTKENNLGLLTSFEYGSAAYLVFIELYGKNGLHGVPWNFVEFKEWSMLHVWIRDCPEKVRRVRLLCN